MGNLYGLTDEKVEDIIREWEHTRVVKIHEKWQQEQPELMGDAREQEHKRVIPINFSWEQEQPEVRKRSDYTIDEETGLENQDLLAAMDLLYPHSLACVFKYVVRVNNAELLDPQNIEDLKKAQDYLQFAIDELERYAAENVR